jgi:hypothetical protein
MALVPKFSDAAANAAANAICALLDGGELRIYDTPNPADANTGITTQTLLATLTFGTPAFNAAAAGVAAATAIGSGVVNAPGGTAAWFRAVTSLGTTITDGTVDTAGANLNLNGVALVTGATVAVSSFTLTQNEG